MDLHAEGLRRAGHRASTFFSEDVEETAHRAIPRRAPGVRAYSALYERYVADASTIDAFADAVDRYAQFHWKHMRREEQEVLPVAAQALTADDWAHIDAAFASNSDPIVGVPARRAFRELFRRLVALLPPPYGVGPEA